MKRNRLGILRWLLGNRSPSSNYSVCLWLVVLERNVARIQSCLISPKPHQPFPLRKTSGLAERFRLLLLVLEILRG